MSLASSLAAFERVWRWQAPPCTACSCGTPSESLAGELVFDLAELELRAAELHLAAERVVLSELRTLIAQRGELLRRAHASMLSIEDLLVASSVLEDEFIAVTVRWHSFT